MEGSLMEPKIAASFYLFMTYKNYK